jgi:hypothetical protein
LRGVVSLSKYARLLTASNPLSRKTQTYAPVTQEGLFLASKTGLNLDSAPDISNGPLISWMYPVFGIRGASWFLGVSEWTFGTLLFLGFWNKKLGMLGAAGSVITFASTVTIIPFMPDGWAASAGGFPAMIGNVAFLMKDVVLLAASVYLLRQDALRVWRLSERGHQRANLELG